MADTTLLTVEMIRGWRRGLQLLLRPDVETFGDAIAAIQALQEFFRRIEQQVQDNLTVLLTAKGRTYENTEARYRELMEWVRQHLVLADESAQFWKSGGHGEPEQQQMLRLYRTDFADALSIFDKRKARTHNGERYGTGTQVPFLEGADKLFSLLREIARFHAAQGVEPRTRVDREYDLHGMKFITLIPEASRLEMKLPIEGFDRAYQLLHRKRLDAGWYGRVLLLPDARAGENQYGKDFGVGGRYYQRQDDIQIYQAMLTVKPERLASLLLHEIGHRYWYRTLQQPQRQQFIEWIRQDDVKAVSHYGSMAPEEAWAEVFMAYCDNSLEMSRDQIDSFKAVLDPQHRQARAAVLAVAAMLWGNGMPDAARRLLKVR